MKNILIQGIIQEIAVMAIAKNLLSSIGILLFTAAGEMDNASAKPAPVARTASVASPNFSAILT